MKPSFYSPLVVALLGLILATASPAQTTATTPKVKKLPFHGKLAAVDMSAQTITMSGKSARVFHLTPTTKITDGAGNPSTLSTATVGEPVGGSYTKDDTGTMTLYSLRIGAKVGSKEAAKEAAAAAAPTAAAAPVATAPMAAPAPMVAPAPAPAPAAAAAAAPVATSAAAEEDEAAPAAAATTKAKKMRFTGKVVSVDTTANTLVVHGKTDQTFTIASTTKIKGGTLDDLTAGSKVSGTYVKSPDGTTLTLATLKITP